MAGQHLKFYSFILFYFLIELICIVSSLPKPCPKIDVLYGTTRSKSRGRVLRTVCHKGFLLIGERTLFCDKGVWDSEIPICAKAGCKLPQGRVANGKVQERYGNRLIRTVCDEGYELQGSLVLFCNGVNWNDTLPTCLGTPTIKVCDFEGKDVFCGWSQTKYMLNWRLGYDPLEYYFQNSPVYDHTYGIGNKGHYLHMVGPIGITQYLKSGQIKSPTYRKPENPNICFQFWYHIFGDEWADLKVLVNNNEEWSRNQINQKIWQRGSFHFLANSTYQIMIEATVPNNMVTVALDDLEIIENCDNIQLYENLDTGMTCENRCGEEGTVDDCSCYFDCHEMDNCCPDYTYFCNSNENGTTIVTESTVINQQFSNTDSNGLITTIIPLTKDNVNESDNNSSNSTIKESQSNVENNEQNSDILFSLDKPEQDLDDEISYQSVDQNKNIYTLGNNTFKNEAVITGTESKTVKIQTENENVPYDNGTSTADTDTGLLNINTNPVENNNTNSMTGNDNSSESDIKRKIEISDVNNFSNNNDNDNGNIKNQNDLKIISKQNEVSDKNHELLLKEIKQENSILQNKPTNDLSDDKTNERENYIEDHNDKSRTIYKEILEESLPNINKDKNKESVKKSNVVFPQTNITEVGKTEASATGITVKSINIFEDTNSKMPSDKNNLNNSEIMKDIQDKKNNYESKTESIINVNETNLKSKNVNIISEENVTKSNNTNNKNLTKIILYKTDNSTNQHISRIQINHNSNMTESFNINDATTYNATTLTRLKQLKEHIMNVIATNGNNLTNSSNLHQLTQFFDSVIDNYNNNSSNENEKDIEEEKEKIALVTELIKLENSLPVEKEINNDKNNDSIKYTINNTNETKNDKIENIGTKSFDNSNIGIKNTYYSNEETKNNYKMDDINVMLDNTNEDSTKYLINKNNIGNLNINPINKIINSDQNKTNTNISMTTYKDNIYNNNNNNLSHILNSIQNKTESIIKLNEYIARKNINRYNTTTALPKSYTNLNNLKTILQKINNITNSMNKRFNSTTWKLNSTLLPTTKYNGTLLPTTSKTNVTNVNRRFQPFYNATLFSTNRKFNGSMLPTTTNRVSIGGKIITLYPIPKNRRFKVSQTKTTTPGPKRTPSSFLPTMKSSSENDPFSISLLKDISSVDLNKKSTRIDNKDDIYKYNTVADIQTKDNNIVLHAISSNQKIDDNSSSSSMSSISTLLSIFSVILLISAILLSSITSYCLIKRFKRKRADDIEIEYLTADELLYFHTPSPELRSQSINVGTL